MTWINEKLRRHSILKRTEIISTKLNALRKGNGGQPIPVASCNGWTNADKKSAPHIKRYKNQGLAADRQQ